jgi:hypothetical protein
LVRRAEVTFGSLIRAGSVTSPPAALLDRSDVVDAGERLEVRTEVDELVVGRVAFEGTNGER